MKKNLTMSEIRHKLINDRYKKRYEEKEIESYEAMRGANIKRKAAMHLKRLPK